MSDAQRLEQIRQGLIEFQWKDVCSETVLEVFAAYDALARELEAAQAGYDLAAKELSAEIATSRNLERQLAEAQQRIAALEAEKHYHDTDQQVEQAKLIIADLSLRLSECRSRMDNDEQAIAQRDERLAALTAALERCHQEMLKVIISNRETGEIRRVHADYQAAIEQAEAALAAAKEGT